jgi:6,7-dimethyl-8-ribityllumazine synthase
MAAIERAGIILAASHNPGSKDRSVPSEQPKVIEGELLARDLRFAFVAARFNDFVVEALIRGAIDALKRHGAAEKQIEIVRVPGAFDIPIVARKLALSRRYDALLALGAVVRGDTPHFDYVAGECASGLARIALESGIPVAFGVLTTDTMEQAVDRAGGKGGNKGADAALAAIEMANLLRRLDC